MHHGPMALAAPAGQAGQLGQTVRVAWRRAAPWTALALVLVTWFVVFRPQALGGPTGYISVEGGSMVPALHEGDLTLVRRASRYEVGDVVAFEVPNPAPGEPGKVIHRVVGSFGPTAYVTKGDNNPVPDTFHPTGDEIVGRVWIEGPGAGRLLASSLAPFFFVGLGLLGIALFVRGSLRAGDDAVADATDDDGVMIDLRDRPRVVVDLTADATAERSPARR